MATKLPQEITDLIADHLNKSQVSLAPCTLVCRQWKAAFEPLIYSTLNIYSGDSNDLSPNWGSWRKGIPEKSISLSQFKLATSGAGNTRRKTIRHLSYHIIVPVILKDWTFLKNSAYTTDNDIRNNNDLAFQSAMLDLFDFLSSWDPTHRVSLALRVVGRELKRERETAYCGDAFRHPLDRCKNPGKCVPVYRAKFEENMASSLPFVACIDRLAFEKFVEHQIWAGSALQIAQKCSALSELQLDLDEYIRPDFLDYIKARRQAVSHGIETLPKSLRIFDYSNADESPWETAMPGLNVLISENDSLSHNIGRLSLSLRHLKIELLSLSPDFLFPLDESGNPLSTSISLRWSFLEKLELLDILPILPSGEWLAHMCPEDQEMVNEIEDWEEIIYDAEQGEAERSIFEAEHFHRLLISLGHAAYNMPRLTFMKYSLNHPIHFDFELKVRPQRREAEWSLESNYRPDQRVAEAWRSPLEELDEKLRSENDKLLATIIKLA